MPILSREPDVYPAEIFERADPGSRWWVAQVRGRQEKRLARHLRDRRIAYCLPQREKRARRKARARSSYLPVLPGYVFFRGDPGDRRQAFDSLVVLTVLDVFDQSRLETELRDLWRLTRSSLPLEQHPFVEPGQEVRVTDGPFAGFRGTVVRSRNGSRLVVSLTLLRRSVAAEVDRDAVEPWVEV